jgi:hypothetical protein
VHEEDLNPDIAAELRLLRAEITALREPPRILAHPAETAHPPRAWFPGFDAAGRLVLPAHHQRMASKIRPWLHLRARVGHMPHAKVSRQRRLAIWLTITSAARVILWVIAMGIIVLHWAGVGGPLIHWFTSLSGEVIFVTFISFYCNAATDGASLTASISALFSADSHAAAIATGVSVTSDISTLEADIARLASLQPGPEAARLAADIRLRLTTVPGSTGGRGGTGGQGGTGGPGGSGEPGQPGEPGEPGESGKPARQG